MFHGFGVQRIAMENGPFKDVFLIKSEDFPIAVLVYQRYFITSCSSFSNFSLVGFIGLFYIGRCNDNASSSSGLQGFF